ncbi:hypothetical protein NYE67_02700 [Solibacillus sp. FSL W8-0474]|uniref:hypothetical protein n=1 Tax=Solibacillus sp. FSL W8-0474 TaxID=2975336 RepID=UPI0030FB2423
MIYIMGNAAIYSRNLNIIKEFTTSKAIPFLVVKKSSIKQINPDSVECDISFIIQLPNDPECKSLEDYRGKELIFLVKHLNVFVRRTEIINIFESEDSIKHITEYFKDL